MGGIELIIGMLWLLFEALGDAILELLLEFGFASLQKALGRENHGPALATAGYLILGAVLGGVSVLLFPRRVLRPGPIGGLSLIVSPVAAGVVMAWWGARRRAGGHPATNLATWYGGAAFAFALSLVRYVFVG